MKKSIILVIIGLILGTTITVTAALVTNADNITFSSDKTDKTNVKEAIDELYTKTTDGTQCPEGKWCIEVENKIANIVNVGDYIKMTPTSTSYTIPTSITGHTSEQTINPSELNLWRVIRKNADGTVEVVSEYVSNTIVYFRGKEGYINLVGGLNNIAAQYTNVKYVQSTRHMGYSNQIEKCSSISSCPTDTGYITDTDLVKAAMGTIIGKKTDGTAAEYFLASRNIYHPNAYYYYRFRTILADGSRQDDNYIYINNESYNLSIVSDGSAIRPILTLKADVAIKSGDGKSAETAYVFK